jgi:hypothetical protein
MTDLYSAGKTGSKGGLTMVHFPTEEDMRSLYSCFPFESLEIKESDFAIKQTNDKEGFVKPIELSAWKIVLHNK